MKIVKIFLLNNKSVRFFVFSLLTINYSLLPVNSAEGALDYTVARDGRPVPDPEQALFDRMDRVQRVYVYGGYNFGMTRDFGELNSTGGIRSNPMAGIGFRFFESIRMELAYEGMDSSFEFGDYYTGMNDVSLRGDFGFVNIIFDAKLPRRFRMFKTSPFTPFVGFGAGAGLVGASDLAYYDRAILPAYNFLGGVSVDINRTLSVVMTYKYIRLLSYELDAGVATFDHFSPSSHNASLSLRVNF